MSQLIVDIIPFKPVLTESKTRPGIFEMEGVVQRAGSKNQNGRVYHKPILEREVNNYIKEFVERGCAFGELDHPESSIVSLKNASHVIKDLRWKGDDLIGRIEILNTPAGNIIKEIAKAGYAIGISSRGTGSVQQTNEGFLEVQDDFTLVCFDLVSNPSTLNAWMNPVSLNESKQTLDRYFKVNQIINEILRN